MKSKTSLLRVLYASSEQSADLLYLSGVFVPDPFLAFVCGRRRVAVVNRLEYGRVRSVSHFDEVLPLEEAVSDAARALDIPSSKIGTVELILFFAALWQQDVLEVPRDFPAVHYAGLQNAGMNVQIGPTPFFLERVQKTVREVRAIRAGNAASTAGLRLVGQVLRDSVIKGNRIYYRSKVLTSESLRSMIEQVCLARGGLAMHTIVACGRQACDPHECGYGPLKPNELIIVDIFPRMTKTGYFGDMTRTFLKGKANDEQRRLVGTVREAQRAALSVVKAGRSGSRVHQAAEKVFSDNRYLTEERDGEYVGFIHSTGHGLGLEIHEEPRVSRNAKRLRAGQVITVEPGLYYPEIGGCRIEDVVQVTRNGYDPLSSCGYRWEIA
ncbi:MAG: M24 family metallopeptidase [Coraliomargaritaceae bacterium]